MAANGGVLPKNLASGNKTTEEMLKLADGIKDGVPVGVKYELKNGTLTVSVPATTSVNDYPKKSDGKDPGEIKIVTNLVSGTVTYAPDENYFSTSNKN